MKTIEQREEALTAHLAATFGRKYREGQTDCALFLAEWVDTLTGSQHANRLRGSYRSHFEGLRRHAPTGINEAVEATLLADGWQTVLAEFQTGDVVFTDQGGAGIWRRKCIVCPALNATGHLYLHVRHAKGGLRWP